MPIITPKDTIQKTYRLETRQADDLEKLAKAVGRTQNELIVMAVTELLYQNRQYFVTEVIEKRLTDELEHIVRIRENEYRYKTSSWSLEMIKLDNDKEGESWFHYCYEARNKKSKVIFREEGEIDVKKEADWSIFLEKVLANMQLYADVDDEETAIFFHDYFASRS
ncbi:MAG: hypothetical protein IAC13_10080 [Firmicutes bacterium]|uniref:Uncharacterized protein n=1 Tax=Candidatus Scybalomonas excrementavium TaxID=2840943 RepID=A0A9D9N8L5_9FIRM|nr:hypothetical protein [Candidatus Scybalomonas excrementavium]